MKKWSKVITVVMVIVIGGFALRAINAWDTDEKVKNVIFMIGDGMGVSHVTATMLEQNYEQMNLERADYIGLIKTYSANNRITDSAAAGTAMASGTKTNNGYIGVDAEGKPLASVREIAEEAGMPTGIVATYEVTHATPASFVAHNISRHEQYDMAEEYLRYSVDVIMGGGAKRFGARPDGRNFVDSLVQRGYVVGKTLADVEAVTEGKVAVLAAEGHMPSVVDGRGDFLPEATAKALEVLSANAKKAKKGFFLMVEGSQIDGKAHGNDIEGVVAETVDFDKAVKVAFDFADNNPGTLVVVAADHETGGLTIVNSNRKINPADTSYSYAWSTTWHSGGMTPVYAYGAGAEKFSRVMENTDLPKIMIDLLGLE